MKLSSTSWTEDFLKNKNHLLVVCFLLLVVSAAFSLSYPLIMRTTSANPLYVGDQSYLILLNENNANVQSVQVNAQTASIAQINHASLFSNSVGTIPFSATNYIYQILFTIFPAWSLPAILSFVLLCLLWFALLRMDIPVIAKFITTCTLIFSPLFVSSQLSLGPAIFTFIGIIALFLALRNHAPHIVTFLISVFLGLLGLDIAFAFILTLLFSRERSGYAPIHGQKRWAAVGGCLGLLTWFIGILKTGTSLHALITVQTPDRLFIEFGSMHGQTILLSILAIVGIALSWKREYRWQVVAACALVLWSVFFPATNLIAAGVISYFAAIAFVRITKAKWQHTSLKTIVLATILISVLTSYFVYTHQLVDASPTTRDLAVYDYIDKNTKSDAIIFAPAMQGSYISYFAHRKAYWSNLAADRDYDNRSQEYQKILYTRELAAAIDELKENNVTHILVDPALASTNQWVELRGGLALLLRNRKVFNPIYTAGDYRLYEINYVEANREIAS